MATAATPVQPKSAGRGAIKTPPTPRNPCTYLLKTNLGGFREPLRIPSDPIGRRTAYTGTRVNVKDNTSDQIFVASGDMT